LSAGREDLTTDLSVELCDATVLEAGRVEH
jgi:hypothetical protein